MQSLYKVHELKKNPHDWKNHLIVVFILKSSDKMLFNFIL